MQRIEYKNESLDRSEWPAGPWDDEPDKIQWEDEKTGLPCLIVRNHFGALCGYVGVPRGHRFYETRYDDVYADGDYPPVHGGLTFASKCSAGPENEAICHLVEPGEDDDVWWLGFDCGHYLDVQPRMLALSKQYGFGAESPQVSYKPVGYVQNNIEELAEWLVEQ